MCSSQDGRGGDDDHDHCGRAHDDGDARIEAYFRLVAIYSSKERAIAPRTLDAKTWGLHLD